jgi:hypothetical protein
MICTYEKVYLFLITDIEFWGDFCTLSNSIFEDELLELIEEKLIVTK